MSRVDSRAISRSGVKTRRDDPYYVRVNRLWAVYAFLGLFVLWMFTPAQAAAANICLETKWIVFSSTPTRYTDAAALCASYEGDETETITTACNLGHPMSCPFGPDLTPPISSGDAIVYGYTLSTGDRRGVAFYDSAGNTPYCPGGETLTDLGGGAYDCVPEPEEPDCDEIDAPPGTYFCTRSDIGAAQDCVEGAVGPMNCMMETCPGAPQVALNFQVGTNKNCLQNNDGTWSCAAELCPTGEYIASPGPDDQLDTDDLPDQELETTESEANDCTITGETTREVIPHGDYVEVCTSTRTYTDGPSCATDGESREVRECNITYQDGSEAQTRSEIDRDGETITGQNDSITARGPNAAEESVEEDDESSLRYGACNAPPQCEGDVLQCAQIELQWLTMCADIEGTRGAAEGIDAAGDEYLDGITGEEIDITDSLSFYDAVGPLSGFRTCPAPLQMVLRGQTIEFSLEHYCTYAGYLSFLILAFASYKGGRIVLQGFAGA